MRLALLVLAVCAVSVGLQEPFVLEAIALPAVLVWIAVWELSGRYGFFACFFAGWVVANSSLIVLDASLSQVSQKPLFLSYLLQKDSLYWAMLLVTLALINPTKRQIEKTLGVLCIANAVLTLFRFGVGAGPIGLSTVISLNACITAMLLPFLFKSHWAFFLLAVASIVVQEGIIANAMMALYGVVYIFQGSKIRGFYIALVAVFSFVAVCFSFDHADGQRLQHYMLAVKCTLRDGWFSGHGLGSYFFLGNIGEWRLADFWPALHGDFVQLFFETGLVGLVLGILVWIESLIRAWRKSHAVCLSLLGATAFAALYHPFRVPVAALPIAMMVLFALRRDDVEELSQASEKFAVKESPHKE